MPVGSGVFSLPEKEKAVLKSRKGTEF